MSIAFIQPIFAPDKPRLQRNLESIESFGSYIKKYPFPGLEIIYGGWSKDQYWTQIKETIQHYISKDQSIKKFDQNYGKAKVVNTLHKVANSNYKYILTADSDIIFKLDEPNMFERLLEVAEHSKKIRNKPFGLIALNQEGHNCHLKGHVYQNRCSYEGNTKQEEIVWPNGKGGIAGGCIFCSKEMWSKVKGYREMGVYAGDDAYLLIDCANKGYSIQMYETLSVIHPHDNDEEYSRWKVHICQRDGSGNDKLNKNKINEAQNFWIKHGKY